MGRPLMVKGTVQPNPAVRQLSAVFADLAAGVLVRSRRRLLIDLRVALRRRLLVGLRRLLKRLGRLGLGRRGLGRRGLGRLGLAAGNLRLIGLVLRLQSFGLLLELLQGASG